MGFLNKFKNTIKSAFSTYIVKDGVFKEDIQYKDTKVIRETTNKVKSVNFKDDGGVELNYVVDKGLTPEGTFVTNDAIYHKSFSTQDDFLDFTRFIEGHKKIDDLSIFINKSDNSADIISNAINKIKAKVSKLKDFSFKDNIFDFASNIKTNLLQKSNKAKEILYNAALTQLTTQDIATKTISIMNNKADQTIKLIENYINGKIDNKSGFNIYRLDDISKDVIEHIEANRGNVEYIRNLSEMLNKFIDKSKTVLGYISKYGCDFRSEEYNKSVIEVSLTNLRKIETVVQTLNYKIGDINKVNKAVRMDGYADIEQVQDYGLEF